MGWGGLLTRNRLNARTVDTERPSVSVGRGRAVSHLPQHVRFVASGVSTWTAMAVDGPGPMGQRWWHRGPLSRRNVRLSVGTVLAFLFVFYVALPLVASHRAEVATLTHIHPGYLALGVLLELAALVAYTQLTHAVLPPGGPRRSRLFRINLSTMSLSHVAPGGTAPGAALGYRLLTQSGVSGSDAGFALGTQGIGSAVVLNALFWLALAAFLGVHGFHVPAAHRGGSSGSPSGSILVMVAAGVGMVLLAAFAGLLWLVTRGPERAHRVAQRMGGRLRFVDPDRLVALVEGLASRFADLMADRSLTRRAIGWAAANWLLDAASLWVFVAAFGHSVSPIDLLTAYGLANILAAIPITPAGLGVVELVLVSMITGFGPTAGQALSGVLAYRAVNFWLPIPVGGLAYASLELERRGPLRRWRAARATATERTVATEPSSSPVVSSISTAPFPLGRTARPRRSAAAHSRAGGVTPCASEPSLAPSLGAPAMHPASAQQMAMAQSSPPARDPSDASQQPWPRGATEG